MKPYVYFMIGLPASGKSTLASKLIELIPSKPIIVSSDMHIENYALANDKTYNEVFKDFVKTAEKRMYEDAEMAFFKGYDVIWDQTNLSRKSRQKKLAMVPNEYRKIACVVSAPENLRERLYSRPGKFISEHIVESMAQTYVPPTKEEGFDSILVF